MKALSIRNPWAWAILHAGKRIENRSWGKSSFRGEVLIHASKRPSEDTVIDDALDFGNFCRERRIQLPHGATPGKLTARDLFRDCGGIVGVARVVDIRPNGDAPESPWAIAGLTGLVLDDVRALPAIVHCNGALGFWNVPDSVMGLVNEQLRLLREGERSEEDRQEMRELGA